MMTEQELRKDQERDAPEPTAPPGSLEDIFTYHKPTDETIPKYQELRLEGLALAKAIDRLCPPGPDRTAAIRLVREAVMTANASIALNGASYR